MKIVTINCDNCSGRGYHTTKAKEFQPDGKGGGVYVEVEYQEDCSACDGKGYIEISSEE